MSLGMFRPEGPFETRLFINNEFVPAVSGKTFSTVNPATEKVIAEVSVSYVTRITSRHRNATCSRCAHLLAALCAVRIVWRVAPAFSMLMKGAVPMRHAFYDGCPACCCLMGPT